ncbi:1-deoxy-D-xylulose-5-phosphate reductoisomerase [Pseudaeromonas paramecii]|uniref:1-deoxy-D-xylulose 5-phosphate reductoisomerase n=1 Tax=Pseudaeromonas paramecii TaxID=2138166 RepID=A0ABP8Q3M4_9GAMM
MQRVTVLGSTGSIGRSTLDIIRRHRQTFAVTALAAHRDVTAMLADCLEFEPRYAVMADEAAAQQLREALASHQSLTEVLSGAEALCEVARLAEVDQVMAAIVGAAGLLPALAAVKAGKTVLLANKEALVMSGALFMEAARDSGARILPVDSEHNAIFQCLPQSVQQQLGFCDLAAAGVHKILLTGSGGPFRYTPVEQLAAVTPEQAVAHPNWSMGRKISVDSATMMNKGLEYIEARWLFNAQPEQMQVVIHPQSVIHSMVQYKDGSVLAQMGQPDMRTPIAYVMSYPARIASGVGPLDFCSLGELTFLAPDYQRYPGLQLAMEACWAGQGATTALNAANEMAVASFLAGQIGFTTIHTINAGVVERLAGSPADDLTAILGLDDEARRLALQLIQERI